jgi:hypothetical protein
MKENIIMQKISLNKNKLKNEPELMWNEFVDWASNAEEALPQLTHIQKNAVLCFWYYSEMSSGGHSGYFDCYPNIEPIELKNAMEAIGVKKLSQNFLNAANNGIDDDYEETDSFFYQFDSEYMTFIENYIKVHSDEFFEIK